MHNNFHFGHWGRIETSRFVLDANPHKPAMTNFPKWAIWVGLGLLALCAAFVVYAQTKTVKNQRDIEARLKAGTLQVQMSPADAARIEAMLKKSA